MNNRPLSIFDVFIPEFSKLFEEERTKSAILVNAHKTEDAIVYDFALHGFNREEVNVEAVDSFLIVSAKKVEQQSEDIQYEYVEFQKIKEATRRISVPKEYDLSKISAEFKDGILKVSVSLKDKKEPVKVVIQ